ncbi:MAG: hypothetical protein LBD60_02530 [Puniceicoccales bacterium]|jgi:hypothetical protein|nr:hypothetical protein [Puniceicoccales bacterium]
MVRLLLDRGANVNVILKEEVPGEFGYTLHHLITPLTIAIRLNVRHRNIINYIRLFLEKGANMNPGSGAMRVPLLEALTYHSCISDEPAESDAVLLLLNQPHIDFNAYQNEPLTFVYDEGREAYYRMEEGALAEEVLEAPKSLKTMIPNSLMLKTLQIVEQVLLPRMRAEGYQI